MTANSSLSPQAINGVLNPLNTTLKQNYFGFENKYYPQDDGLDMGSPLYGVLADIYLRHIEQNDIKSQDNRKILERHTSKFQRHFQTTIAYQELPQQNDTTFKIHT